MAYLIFRKLVYRLALICFPLLSFQNIYGQCEGVKNSGNPFMLDLQTNGSSATFDVAGAMITISFNKNTGKTEITGTNGMKFHTDGNGNIVNLGSSVNIKQLNNFQAGPAIMYDLANNTGAFGGGVAGFIGIMIGERFGYIEMLKCGATTCGEYVMNIDNAGLSATVDGSATTNNCASLSITAPVVNDPSIYDPCSCDDPLNVVGSDGEVILFHDYVEVSDNAGQTWTFTAVNSGDVLDQNGAPIALNTALVYNATTGRYRMDLYHRNSIGFNLTVTRASDSRTLSTGGSCTSCLPIPTMSEWGLLIFGLLVLNISVFFLFKLNSIQKALSDW